MRVTEKCKLEQGVDDRNVNLASLAELNMPSSPESFCESVSDSASELDNVVAFRRLLFLNRIKSALRLGFQPVSLANL